MNPYDHGDKGTILSEWAEIVGSLKKLHKDGIHNLY
jgi:hypothetical protein